MHHNSSSLYNIQCIYFTLYIGVKCGVRARGILETQQGCTRCCDLNCVCVKDYQPFLLTQNAITEILKYVISFCALKYGNAINVALSVEVPEA